MISPNMKGTIKTVELKTSEDVLSVVLANLYVIGIKAKNYHWNTEGPTFYGDHKTYDEIYNGAYDQIDIIGERMRALQYKVRSDLPFIMKNATVSDDFETEADEMCCDMTDTLEEFSANLHEGFYLCGSNHREYSSRN